MFFSMLWQSTIFKFFNFICFNAKLIPALWQGTAESLFGSVFYNVLSENIKKGGSALVVREPTYGAHRRTLEKRPTLPSDEMLANIIGLLVGDGSFITSLHNTGGRRRLQYKITIGLARNEQNRFLLNYVRFSLGGIGSGVFNTRHYSEERGYYDAVAWTVSAQVHVLWLAKLVYSSQLLRLSFRTSVRVIRMIECIEGGLDHYGFMEKLGFPEGNRARLLSQPETVGVWPWKLPKPLRFENVEEVLGLGSFDDFIVGFSEAECSFFHSSSAVLASGIEVWNFSIAQADDKIIIDSIRIRFNIVGIVRRMSSKNYPNNVWLVDSTDVASAVTIADFFENKPFLGHKAESFRSFAAYVDLRRGEL